MFLITKPILSHGEYITLVTEKLLGNLQFSFS